METLDALLEFLSQKGSLATQYIRFKELKDFDDTRVLWLYLFVTAGINTKQLKQVNTFSKSFDLGLV